MKSTEFLNQQRQESATNLDNAFKALDSTRGEIQSLIDDGTVQLENLNPAARRLLDNPSMLASRDPQALKFFASDPTKDAESELRLSNLERGQEVQKGLDDSLGGASNVGLLQGKSMKETLAGQKASRERTESLTDATKLQMELLKRPVNTTIPGNENLAKEIKSIDQEISRLREIKTLDQDEDGRDKIVKDVSIDSATTGAIVDTFGYPSVSYDRIKVIIETGGTFAAGTTSTVTYKTFVGDDSGLKINANQEAEIIDGSFQPVGHGVYVRFSTGVYTANDEWEVEVSGLDHTSGGGIETIQLKRR